MSSLFSLYSGISILKSHFANSLFITQILIRNDYLCHLFLGEAEPFLNDPHIYIYIYMHLLFFFRVLFHIDFEEVLRTVFIGMFKKFLVAAWISIYRDTTLSSQT